MKTHLRLPLIAACSLACCAATPAFANKGADHHFKMMDTNKDGRISRAEHADGAKKMFTQCDANRDGIVTAAEMEASTTAMRGQAGVDDKSAAEKIQVIDQNGDGKLTVAEHTAGSEKMFGKMDTDGDGFLSKSECDAGMKMMKKDTQ